MVSDVLASEVQSSAVRQAASFVADLDFLIQAHADGLLDDDELNNAKAALIAACPDPEVLILLDSTRYVPLD